MRKAFICSVLAFIILTFSFCRHKPDTSGIIPPPPPPRPPVNCSADTVYFQNDVLPMFISTCAKSDCHDGLSYHLGKLIIPLLDYSTINIPGNIITGNPDSSKIYKRITSTDTAVRMPRIPDPPLTTEQINLIYKWILQGALNNICESTNCDSINITYTNPIKSIVQSHCLGCHSGPVPANGMSMENYSALVDIANSGRLMGAIRHDSGYFAMPKLGGQLSVCHIAQFQQWINLGTPQ